MTPRKKSKEIAKERLRVILIHDRIELSPHELKNLKSDIGQILSKYLRIDSKEIDLKVSREVNSMALEAKIPFKKPS